MNNTITFFTEENNTYLYNLDLSLSIWIHPELIKAYKQILEVDPYYLRKYNYLKARGFFSEAVPVEFGTVLDESVIKHNIAQVPQISFETTDHCNLNCRYCSLGDLYTFAKNDRKNIDTKRALHLLRYIFNLKSEGSELTIGFFGGEPLVNGEFIKTVINEAKRLNRKKKLNLNFSITTNATLIDLYMDLLVENQFIILISLDGDEEGQSYRTYAKNSKNSFFQVIHNIDRLQQEYPDFFKDKVEFNAVLHDRNSVHNIYEFIYNRYHKIPRIAQLNIDHVNLAKKELLDQLFKSRRESEEEFHESGSNLLPVMFDKTLKFNEFKDFLADYSVNFYMTNLLDLLYDQVNLIPTKTCSPFQRKIYFSTNSQLLPCEKVSYQYFIGKVKDTVEIDIAGTAQRYSSYYERIQTFCQHCYNRRTCSICLLTLDNLEDLGKEQFSCPNFMDEVSFADKLRNIFSFLEANPSSFAQVVNAIRMYKTV